MVTTLENDIFRPDVPIWLVLATLAAGMAWAYYVARRRTAVPRAARLDDEYDRGYGHGQWEARDYVRRRFAEGFTLLLGRDRKMHWVPPRDVEHMRDEPPLDHLPGQAEYRARLAELADPPGPASGARLATQETTHDAVAGSGAYDHLTTAELAARALGADDSPPIFRAALNDWRGTTTPPGPEQPREAEATAQAAPSPDSGQPGPGGLIALGNTDLAELVALADLPGPGGGAQLGEQIDAYLEGRPSHREHTDVWRIRMMAEHRDFTSRNGLPAAELDWWEE